MGEEGKRREAKRVAGGPGVTAGLVGEARRAYTCHGEGWAR